MDVCEQIDAIAADNLREWLAKFGNIIMSNQDFFDTLRDIDQINRIGKHTCQGVTRVYILSTPDHSLSVYGHYSSDHEHRIHHTDVHLNIKPSGSFIEVIHYFHPAGASSCEKKSYIVPLNASHGCIGAGTFLLQLQVSFPSLPRWT